MTDKDDKISDQVVSLLNQAQSKTDSASKVKCLKQVQELLIHQAPFLLDNFLDELLSFMNDPLMEVRKFVLAFIEQASKKDDETIAKALPNVAYLFASDTNVNVQKRVITTAAHLYPLLFNWSIRTKSALEAQKSWETFQLLKSRIQPLLDHENDGIISHTIKFYETCILVQSVKSEDSEKLSGISFMSLDDLPRDHRFISYRGLESDCRVLVKRLLEFLASAHITSVNLITTLQSVTKIGRARPVFMSEIITAMETLHVNLPPTLAKSQVASVRKTLKMHLLTLLQHKACVDLRETIVTLLTDLGASQQQINKCLPQEEPMAKRKKIDENVVNAEQPGISAQQPQDDDDDDDEDKKPIDDRQRMIDLTADYLKKSINPTIVSELVMIAMTMLPESMPPTFASTFTPIAKAGTDQQIAHVAKLMATQFTAANIGPGYEKVQREKEEMAQKEAGQQFRKAALQSIMQTVKTGEAPESIELLRLKHEEEQRIVQAQKEAILDSVAPVYGSAHSDAEARKQAKRLQQFGLAYVTRPMDSESQTRMQLNAALRILNAERRAVQGGASIARQKMLVRLAARLSIEQFNDHLRVHIMHEQRARADLALLWLQELFIVQERTKKDNSYDYNTAFASYDQCLYRLLNELLQKGEHKESLFHKLLLEAPLLTDNSLTLLKQACLDSVYGSFAMETLKELIIARHRQRPQLAALLLSFCCSARHEIRTHALELERELFTTPHCRSELKTLIMHYAALLENPTPPPELFTRDMQRTESPDWNEDTVRACIAPLLQVLTFDQTLLMVLSKFYAKSTTAVKRIILRLVESPIKQIGSYSTHLLDVIANCPEGSETLATRIVHVLTGRSAPSPELVKHMLALYESRLTDVRTLAPVLCGLDKNSIRKALPKIVRLNGEPRKDMFSRLLFTHNHQGVPALASPIELVLLLHELPCDTSENTQYASNAIASLMSIDGSMNRDTAAVLMQRLVELPKLPPLAMRTMQQLVFSYDTLKGFVVNILQRLSSSQRHVWMQDDTNPKLSAMIWADYLNCCLHTMPYSFNIIVNNLPVDVLHKLKTTQEGEKLRLAMIQHYNHLTTQQKKGLNSAAIEALRDSMPIVIDDDCEKPSLQENETNQLSKEAEQAAPTSESAI